MSSKIDLFQGQGRDSGCFCVAEMGKGRRAAFDLLDEPGPTVRRPPDPSLCTRHACRFSPTMHARTICPSSHLLL